MYSDPYRGSYHLRSLTEAEILSSRHYRRMTSAPRHGSNYIIQAHNTPAARQHHRLSRSPLPPVVLSALLQFLVFTLLLPVFSFFNLHPDSPPPLRVFSLLHRSSLDPQPSPLKHFTREYYDFNGLGDYSQNLRCRTF